MKNRIKKRRLYRRQSALIALTTIDELQTLLSRFVPQIHGGEVWPNLKPVGNEFGAEDLPKNNDVSVQSNTYVFS